MTTKIINKSQHELPNYETIASAGMDLRANIEAPITLKSLERTIVKTGLFIELPIGYEAQVRPRSGVLGAPWFFRPKESVRGQMSSEIGPESGLLHSNVSLDERFAVLLEHAKQFVEIFGHKQFYRMRQHLGCYCKGFPHAASLRPQMVRVSSIEELQSILEAFHIRPQSGVVLPYDESVDMAETLASRCS